MKKEYKEKIKDLGIGAYFMVLTIFLILIMIGWLIYNIFISSKG
ncbi:Uncharacterised protein [uncultured archaeon]|nr:Uncharacterised protein [uncultured archaeon]